MADNANLPPTGPSPDQRAAAARQVLRGADAATLATSSGPQPHAALVTHACLADATPVLLLSDLSRHTAHLRANPLCALLCVMPDPDAQDSANPQTQPRLSLSCYARPDADPALRARYLARRPYAGLYADFGDFRFWRLTILSAQFVQGFARAFSLGAEELAPDPAAAARIEAAEPELIRCLNQQHAPALARFGRAHTGALADWRATGVDPDGCDLMAGPHWARLSWGDTLDWPDRLPSLLETALARAAALAYRSS
jgi:putative heme iron utilization protein